MLKYLLILLFCSSAFGQATISEMMLEIRNDEILKNLSVVKEDKIEYTSKFIMGKECHYFNCMGTFVCMDELDVNYYELQFFAQDSKIIRLEIETE